MPKWPGESNEAFPEVFCEPKRPFDGNNLKDGQLNQQQFKQFFNEGYVILKEFFPRDLLEDVKKDIALEVEKAATALKKAGKLKNGHEEYGLFERLIKIEEEFPGANVMLHRNASVFMPSAICRLWSHHKALNLAEQLLGTPEILGHPVWNLRTKTPNSVNTTVPWHQDAGYMDKRAYKVLQLTGWIPLLDTVPQNGCMQVLRGGHRKGRVAKHTCCANGTWYVMLDEEEMENSLGVKMETDVVTCPVPLGGILIFNNMLPHRSLNNTSSEIRWSLDLRWQRASEPVGMYDIKEGILLRGIHKGFSPDFDAFNAVNRFKSHAEEQVDEEEISTVISGPWMKQWEIISHNKHTLAFVSAIEKTESSLS